MLLGEFDDHLFLNWSRFSEVICVWLLMKEQIESTNTQNLSSCILAALTRKGLVTEWHQARKAGIPVSCSLSKHTASPSSSDPPSKRHGNEGKVSVVQLCQHTGYPHELFRRASKNVDVGWRHYRNWLWIAALFTLMSLLTQSQSSRRGYKNI